MTAKDTSVVRMPRDDARDVLFTETIENASEPKGFTWGARERARATRDARELAGPDVPPERFLPLRARLVQTRLKGSIPAAPDVSHLFKTFPVVLAIMVGAFALGALTDRLAGGGDRINLLSAPLLGLIVWNLFVYLLLLLGAAGLVQLKSPRCPTERLAALLQRMKLPALGRGPLVAGFLKRWTAAQSPLLRLEAARAFHLGAITFAAGILTGIAVRGISTAYTVGWESTWFANSPDIVRTILNCTYGLVTFPSLGMTPVPDTAGVAAMQFGAPGTGGEPAGASWLLAQMLLLVVFVIVPRALIALQVTWRINRARVTVPVSAESEYYRAILSAPDAPGVLTVLLTDTADKVAAPQWQRLCDQLGEAQPDRTVRLQTFSVWDGTIGETLAALPEGPIRLILGFDVTATPEADVQGEALSTAAAFCRTRSADRPALVLDTSRAVARGLTPRESRLTAWESAAAEAGAEAFTADLSNPEAAGTLIGRLTAPL